MAPISLPTLSPFQRSSRNDTMVKEFNECVMESVEELCSRLIFRPLTKPLGSKLSHNQMEQDKHLFAPTKGG